MKKGFAALYLVVILSVTIAGSAAALFVLSRIRNNLTKNLIDSSQAYFVSEAGLEDAIYRLKKGKKYEATYSFSVSGNQVQVNITDVGNSKEIVARGTASLAGRSLKSKILVANNAVSFHYGAQVDKGGLHIGNGAKVVGNVYSNGSASGAGSGSVVTGDLWVAGSLASQSDQGWSVKDSEFEFGLRRGSIYYLDTAQGFIPSSSNILRQVSFYLKKVGSPSDQTVRILTDGGGKPSKTVLGTGTLKASKVTTNFSWVDVSLDSLPSLVSGQTYWLLIDVSRDDQDYWVWGKDSQSGYLPGQAKYTQDWNGNGVVWNPVGGDLDFKTFLGGEDPTSIQGISVGIDARANTITGSSVGRDAYYQNIDESTQVTGTKHPGSADPAAKDLPISLAQIQGWETLAEAGGVFEGDYTASPGSQLGPVKINGNLYFPKESGANPVIITGPVWVTGEITGEENGQIRLQSGLDFGEPLIADNPADQTAGGKIVFSNNFVTEDNSTGGYLLFVSTNKSLETGDPAISISNNVNKEHASSIVFSLQGLIKVENNAKFKEVSGYALRLENNAQVIYEEGLIDTNFSSGPGASWQISLWQEVE